MRAFDPYLKPRSSTPGDKAFTLAVAGVFICLALGLLVMGGLVLSQSPSRPVPLARLNAALIVPKQKGFRACLEQRIRLEHVLTHEGLSNCEREFGQVSKHEHALGLEQLDLIETSRRTGVK